LPFVNIISGGESASRRTVSHHTSAEILTCRGVLLQVAWSPETDGTRLAEQVRIIA
jgi:hypothetical protein